MNFDLFGRSMGKITVAGIQSIVKRKLIKNNSQNSNCNALGKVGVLHNFSINLYHFVRTCTDNGEHKYFNNELNTYYG